MNIRINPNPPHLTRAEIDAIENPGPGDQYYDTTNSQYVCYFKGTWHVMENWRGHLENGNV